MLELHKIADKSGDQPPTHPETILLEDGSEVPHPQAGQITEPWPLSHVELVGEAPADHNFADTFIARAMGDGYLEFTDMAVVQSDGYGRNPVLTGSEIVLHVADGDLRYRVLEPPGKYGERVSNEYRCELVEEVSGG